MASLFNAWLVSGCEQRNLDWILAEPEEIEEGSRRGYKHFDFYFTISKIFMNVFAWLYAETNPNEISEEDPFFFSQKNADVSIFVEIQG